MRLEVKLRITFVECGVISAHKLASKQGRFFKYSFSFNTVFKISIGMIVLKKDTLKNVVHNVFGTDLIVGLIK
jgi:hypothetical protein